MDGDGELIKVVYEDEGKTKVILGYLVDEEEFIYKIKGKLDGKIIDIGKRNLIKKGPADGGR